MNFDEIGWNATKSFITWVWWVCYSMIARTRYVLKNILHLHSSPIVVCSFWDSTILKERNDIEIKCFSSGLDVHTVNLLDRPRNVIYVGSNASLFNYSSYKRIVYVTEFSGEDLLPPEFGSPYPPLAWIASAISSIIEADEHERIAVLGTRCGFTDSISLELLQRGISLSWSEATGITLVLLDIDCEKYPDALNEWLDTLKGTKGVTILLGPRIAPERLWKYPHHEKFKDRLYCVTFCTPEGRMWTKCESINATLDLCTKQKSDTLCCLGRYFYSSNIVWKLKDIYIPD